MKSFPSTLNESKSMYGSSNYNAYSKSFDIDKLKALNLNTSVPVIQELLKPQNINISNYNGYSYAITQEDNNYRENPIMLPYDIISLAKDYDWIYKNPAAALIGIEEHDSKTYKEQISLTQVSPSMFNPLFGVLYRGITANVPLLNNIRATDGPMEYAENLSSCSIRELCTLSKNPNSILGMATYKYADFMYCKDLGKVSNNHLITLRRFAHPVGDHIFELSAPQYISSEHTSFEQEGDIGRLVTWFGTDDNKLEDILKFSYHATWKAFQADIQEEDSTADDKTTGLLGMLANTSQSYNQAIAEGTGGSHNLWSYLGSRITKSDILTQGVGKNNTVLLRNYDKNRIYTPRNTIQETHKYEGKIEFTHEFTLNFSYKLRAYDNINPKSAFLDLIGNILEVTGRRGRFWGGQRKLIGPQNDMSVYTMANSIIDKSFDKLSGVWGTMMNANINWQNFSGALGDIVNTAKDAAGKFIDGAKDIAPDIKNAGANIYKNITGNAARDVLKGFLKNALGRPTLIAWNSLLSGTDTGLWHVTIGNPKNPIVVMGNLIVTDSQIKQYGPLGLDDFPSDITVSITLKHARPRDLVDISKMYTKGVASIYHHLVTRGFESFYDGIMGTAAGEGDVTKSGGMRDPKAPQKPAKPINEMLRDYTAPQQEKKAQAENNAFEMQKSGPLQNAYQWERYNSKERDTSYGGEIPNPFITNNISLKMAEMNNYSQIMATLSADELI